MVQPQGLAFLLLRFESNEQPARQQISTRQTGQKYSQPFVVTTLCCDSKDDQPIQKNCEKDSVQSSGHCQSIWRLAHSRCFL